MPVVCGWKSCFGASIQARTLRQALCRICLANVDGLGYSRCGTAMTFFQLRRARVRRSEQRVDVTHAVSVIETCESSSALDLRVMPCTAHDVVLLAQSNRQARRMSFNGRSENASSAKSNGRLRMHDSPTLLAHLKSRHTGPTCSLRLLQTSSERVDICWTSDIDFRPCHH